ncbi:hypothetical protein V5O48_018879 [Marasmius crinis-equi]|uniref:HAT C-terminal dimerisation domain-containing protein n=1 Tax=Marasmius crinis-equi TaxID=585013 RepID=A0ABR3EJX6_9AGAR
MLDEDTLTGFPDYGGIQAIIDSVKKRWRKTDQEAFVACLLISPQFGFAPLNTASDFFTITNLCSFLHRVYCRLFSVPEVPLEFANELNSFILREGQYRNLETEVMAEERRAFKDDRDFNPINVLKQFQRIGSRGLSPFLRFATLLLKITCNSASCERLFSIFGNILTKTRNRMGLETLHTLAEIKLHLWQQILRDRSHRDSLKKKFDFAATARSKAQDSQAHQEHPSPTPLPPTDPASETTTEMRINNSLTRWIAVQLPILEDDDNDNDAVRPEDRENYFPMALEDLFDFDTKFWQDRWEKNV